MDNEKKGETDIAEVIRKKLEAHRKSTNKQNPAKKRTFKDKLAKIKRSYAAKTTEKTRKIIPVLIDAVIIIIMLTLIISVGYVFYDAFIKDKQRELQTGLGKAVINNGKVANLIVDDSVILEEVKTINIVFTDGIREYNYEPDYIDKEYELYPNEIGLDNFDEIVSISIFLEHNNEINESPYYNQTSNKNNLSDENTEDNVECATDNDCLINEICLNEKCVSSGESASISPFVRFWEIIKNYS